MSTNTKNLQINNFIQDRCIRKLEAKACTSHLYTAYQSWCEEKGIKAIGIDEFTAELKTRFIEANYWLGVGLLAD